MSNDLYQRQLEKAQKRLEHSSNCLAGLTKDRNAAVLSKKARKKLYKEYSDSIVKNIASGTDVAVAQKNYLCHSLHIPPQAFIIRYTALFSNVDSGYFSRISTLFSITFQQNGVVMVYQTVLYQPDIFRSCRSDDPGKSTSFAICSAAWS